MSYEEVRYSLADRLGISPSDVDDWTLDQIESAWRGGKPRKGVRVASSADARRLEREWRKYV